MLINKAVGYGAFCDRAVAMIVTHLNFLARQINYKDIYFSITYSSIIGESKYELVRHCFILK